MDDGSADDSARRVSARAARDPRIRLLRGPARGLVAALNRGLAAARAPLVARMDADDLMHPRRLEAQLRHLQRHPEITVLGSRACLFADTPLQAGYLEYLRWQNECLTPEAIDCHIYVESPFVHPTVMFRAAAVRRLGGYRHGPFPEDYELWLRLHQAGCRMEKLPEVHLYWREWPARTSRVDPRCSRAAFDRLRAAYLAADPRLNSGRPLVFWGAGRRTRQRVRELQSRGFTPVAWVDIDARKIGQRLAGVPVVSPAWLPERERPFVLVYVASHGARGTIAPQLAAKGYREGSDYLFVG